MKNSTSERGDKAKSNFSEKLLNWRYNLVEPYISPQSQILDLGSGTGWVGKRIQEKLTCDVQLLDILDCNETDLPLKVYDGNTIPFSDKSFDTTLLMFVLHHTLNQETILREAGRVTRQNIIVVEDTPNNIAERIIDSTCDTLMSLEHGFFNPANYKTVDEWKNIFHSLGLIIQACDIEKPFFPFYYTKCVFSLQVPR